MSIPIGELRQKERPVRSASAGIGALASNRRRPASREAKPRTLPVPINNLIGRETEKVRLAELILSSRLITVFGLTGIGKTRLALEAAIESGRQFPDGAWFVDLTGARAGEVAKLLASELGIPRTAGKPSLQNVIKQIKDRRVLLFLDSCDHVVKEVAGISESLLAACTGLSILTTSRQPLNMVGERVWRVGPLSVPKPSDTSIGVIADFNAVRLFSDNARAVRPDFRLNHRTAPVVAEICRILEGIPLALQLAASRMKSMSAEEVLEHSKNDLSFLVQDSETTIPRHRSILAAFDWSFSLLSQPEKVLLRRLSVFSGGFTLSAAQKVCSGGKLVSGKVLDLLEKLESSSLVDSDTSASPTRYRTYETLRRYAALKLDSAREKARFETAHYEWCSDLINRAEPELTGHKQGQWVARLKQEHLNLKSALDRTSEAADAAGLIRMAAKLSDFWWFAGLFATGKQYLEGALSASKSSAATKEPYRAKALWGLGAISFHIDNFEKASPCFEEHLQISKAANDGSSISRAYLGLGMLYLPRNPQTALSWSEKSVSAATKNQDDWCLAEAKANAGRAHMMLGNPELAGEYFDGALEAAERTGEPRGIASALAGKGWLAMFRGKSASAKDFLNTALEESSVAGFSEHMEALLFLADTYGRDGFETARALLEKALAMAQEAGSKVLATRAFNGLARLHVDSDPQAAAHYFDRVIGAARESGFLFILVRALQGRSQLAWWAEDRAAAEAMLVEALEISREAGDKPGMAQSTYPLAMFARADGDDEKASNLYHQALDLYKKIGDKTGITFCLGALAGLAMVQGRLPVAARLFSVAHSLLESDDGVFPGFCHCKACRGNEPQMNKLKKEMGEDQFESAWNEGSQMSVEEAVGYITRGRGSRQDRATKGWASLTRVERNVVALLTEDLTNSEMGERLFMSSRTVGTHLSHIYDKLGLRSRKEVARQFAMRDEQGP